MKTVIIDWELEDHVKTNCSGTNEDWPVDRVSAGASDKAELSHITPVYFSRMAVSSCSPHLPEKGDSAEEWMKCLCIVPLHHCVFCISIIEVPLDFSSTQWAGGPIFFPWKATWLPSLDSRPITTSDTGLFCKRECWMTHNESQACKQTYVCRLLLSPIISDVNSFKIVLRYLKHFQTLMVRSKYMLKVNHCFGI